MNAQAADAPKESIALATDDAMTDLTAGFQNQVWCIRKMDGLTVLSEEQIPLSDASEKDIMLLLEERAKSVLTPREIHDAPQLFKAKDMTGKGNRLIYSAGQNPYYVASLWRSDELNGHPPT
ncbi:hypothetical protein [Rhizobium chutanense]|nr:hypothetical protein [Rhizobium chutanense]